MLTSLLLFIAPLVAGATPITYIYTGTGSGSIGATNFSDVAFTITAQADTSAIASCGGGCQDINHISTRISFSGGLGVFTITSPLRTFKTTIPGLSRQNPPGGDLYNLYDGDFVVWNLISDWGPVNTIGSIGQWASPQIDTTGGVLVFANNSVTPGTFQAILGQDAQLPAKPVPTLSHWAIFLLALLLAAVSFGYVRKIGKAS